MKFNYFALAIFIHASYNFSIYSATIEKQNFKEEYDVAFIPAAPVKIGIRLKMPRIYYLKLTGLQGQPIFYKAWRSNLRPQYRDEVLIYTINNILNCKRSEIPELISDLELILKENSRPILPHTLKVINEKIKEIKENL